MPRCCTVVLFCCALAAPSLLPAQGLTPVRIQLASPAALDSVRRLGVDVVEVQPGPEGRSAVIAIVTARDRAALVRSGWRVEDVQRSPLATAQEERRRVLGAAAFAVYRDFDAPGRGIAAWLRALAASHPNVHLDSLGATAQGRPILAAKIGPADDAPSRANVLLLATHHAREWAATETALRLLVWLADSLPLEPGGAALLAGRDVWVIPVANPDGYQYTFDGDRLWRKNRRANADASFGVDLNRNHESFWGLDDVGSSAVPGSEVYRGPSAGSEPETEALAAFHQAHPPATAVSFHTYAGTVLYPWAHATGVLTGDDAIFRTLAGSDLVPPIGDGLPGTLRPDYSAGPAWRLYPTNGDYTGWAYRRFGTIGVTVELTAGCCVAGQWYGFEFPDDEVMLAQLARDQRPFIRAMLQAAGDPAGLVGPTGAAPAGAYYESVWPEVRVLLPQGTMGTLEIAAGDGAVRAVSLVRDSLGVGRLSVRYVARDTALAGSRGVRVASARLVAEVVLRHGGENAGSGWVGFGAAVVPAVEGARAWAAFADTLVSPLADVVGRRGLTLYYWTQHAGSLYATRARGLVQLSVNDGPWITVDEVRGAASAWYPRAVPLEVQEGAARLRVRFVADSLWWLLDAVTVTASDQRLFGAVARTSDADPLAVSANPVRGDQVTLHWPAGTGSARVEVFSLTGTRVREASFTLDPGRWIWDLTVASGQRAANGPYAIVVTREDGTRLRRRVLVAR